MAPNLSRLKRLANGTPLIPPEGNPNLAEMTMQFCDVPSHCISKVHHAYGWFLQEIARQFELGKVAFGTPLFAHKN